MDDMMAESVTIDAAGRLVVPKKLRDRLRLQAGSQLFINEEAGRLVLSPARPEPALVERDGFLQVDLAAGEPIHADHRQARDERINDLVRYALRR